LDVRVVLFTVADGALLVALQAEDAGLRLPRGRPAPGEPLDGAARRIVHEATGLAEQYMEQLYTLSVPEGPDWTVIISYMALIVSEAGPRPGPPLADGTSWRPATDPSTLGAADRMVLDYARLRLQAKIGYTTIAFHLLSPTFTLTELQGAYEAVLGRSLDKRNFRRRVIAAGILAPTADKRRDGSHRPAALYRFRAEHDREAYLTPPWAEES
jgi:8-oxo-dGTP diphosphatase